MELRDSGTDEPATAVPRLRPKRTRAWITLGVIVAAVVSLFIWGALRGLSPAQTLQRADASDSHGHDLALYEQRLNDLMPKCGATADRIASWTGNTEAILRAGGVTDEDRLALLVDLDQTIIPGQVQSCDELLGAYAALRGVAP